jgi:SAM-dependent methyltransferase
VIIPDSGAGIFTTQKASDLGEKMGEIMSDETHRALNVERFSGFADTYDRYRPTPPAVFIDILTQLAKVAQPARVVDLGCGTGLSTRIWADRAVEVIGIEPNDDMRHEAEIHTTAANIHYQHGFGQDTGLPDSCADIVTVSQALHWMEPEPTLAEIARILRPGGVFAAIDNDWPPVMNWEAEAAYRAFMGRVEEIDKGLHYAHGGKKWAKHEHLSRITASGHFRFTREIVLHAVEMGNAERLIGVALSQGSVEDMIKHDPAAAEAVIADLRETVHRVLSDDLEPWYFSYRVRIGVK